MLLLAACDASPGGNSVAITIAPTLARPDSDADGRETPGTVATPRLGRVGSGIVADVSPAMDPNTGDVAARALVERYLIALACGDDTGSLWRAPGGGQVAFAALYRRFATVRATTGMPFDADAGAGQRYVSVPVRLDGRLRDGGRPLRVGATAILHRVAEGIDGATPADRRWHIERIEIASADPATGPTPDADPAATTPAVVANVP